VTRVIPFLSVVISAGISVSAMAAAAPVTEAASIRLFLDVQQTSVDRAFLQTNLTWVDWVRDREASDVHLIVTQQNHGGGGQQWSLRFVGLERFKGLEDDLIFSAPAGATQDDVRKGLVNQIALGLARYGARLPMADRLVLTQKEADKGAPQTKSLKDPWNAWVFNLGLNSYLNGQSSTASSSLYANLSANRITEDQILRFSASGNWEKSRYDLSDEVLRSSSKSTYGSATIAESISQHWTWGVLGRGSRSDQENIAATFRVAPAIEYNVWKYSESTKKQLTFLYQVGVSRSRYVEETIYRKKQETLLDNSLTASLDLNQPWGSVSTSFSASAYTHDWSKNRLSVFGAVNVKLAKGLSLNFFGSWSRVRDQLALSGQTASDDEILLRLKELQTSYSYFTSIGISYTFGSIFNNTVNSRFRSTQGRSFSF